MGRGVPTSVIAFALVLLLLHAPVTSQTLPEPASNLVRTRAFLTSNADAQELTIDAATLANAIVTRIDGPASIRTVIDHNSIRVSGNPERATFDLRIDYILASVMDRGVVMWRLSSAAPATSRLDVRNLNAAESRVDVFESSSASASFTTDAVLLRRNGPLESPPPVDSHLVLAFFYPWWSSSGWTSPLFLDNPAQLYSVDNPDDLARVMTQAKAAGIDALVVSWAGKDFADFIDHRRMLACLAAGERAGIKIAALFEATVANPQHEDGLADPGTVYQWLADIVDSYATNPVYLRVNGRPVVLAYAAQRMSQAGWVEALARLRASHRDVLMIGEGINNTRLGGLDGLFFYASNLYQGNEIFDFDRIQGLSVRTYHLLPGDSGTRRIWVATVSPGYDDTRLQDGRVTRVTDREDGQYYHRQWQAALQNRADWIVITSWNEWLENTEIEPGVRFHDLYVKMTRSWTLLFRRRPRPS
jgi:hypothetical protein